MARHSLSNCPLSDGMRLAALLLCGVLAACASTPDTDARHEPWPTEDADAATRYLLILREHLAQPPDLRNLHREQLRAAAARGGRAAGLEYALVLSVDLDDRRSLETSVNYLEALLAAPVPLPVALDALVRVQLGQALDRLKRMHASGDIHDAYRAAAIGQQTCHAELVETRGELKTLRIELADVQRKLEAVARIEQTVNAQPPAQPRNDTDDKEEDDAARQSDSDRR